MSTLKYTISGQQQGWMKMKIYFDNKNDLCHFEHVERKGAGHPDTLCDAIAEKASVLYAKYCLENFGRIAHHWFDKTMLIGGESDIKPGYGELIKPYNLIFAGKVTYAVGEHKIPVDSILFNAAEDILCHCLTGFDAEKHMRIENRLVDYQGAGRKESRYRPVSKSILPEINEYTKFTSNDCNLISGYAPFSILETMVIQVEKYINSTDFKQRNPFTGWDVKVFGTREHDDYSLIINLPILAKFCISDLSYENYTRIAKIDIIKYLDEEFNLSSLHRLC
ncbi:methionine adenosyltransferase [Pectobacterium sp. B2J-2]|uniref:methionine adenosyltransferase n=1 Tax=Pectobacterium sp. B2J-2 TaxID=3385372 RepID=UPI0038FCC6F5